MDYSFFKSAIRMPQDWGMCPVGDNMQTPRREDGSFNYDGNTCGGTMWKVVPPRMRMETHEIIMDNDIVVLTSQMV